MAITEDPRFSSAPKAAQASFFYRPEVRQTIYQVLLMVALVAPFYLAGNVVYLDHGEGLISAYFHLSRTDVKLGDIVERGQIIGAVGRTGRVTGPHLHWVTRYGGVTVDPMSVLALLGAE